MQQVPFIPQHGRVLTGAWIETYNMDGVPTNTGSRVLTGAWIETW